MANKFKGNNFRDLVDFCTRRDPNGVAIKWLVGNDIVEKTYFDFRSDIDALGTYFYYNGFKKAKIANNFIVVDMQICLVIIYKRY